MHEARRLDLVGDAFVWCAPRAKNARWYAFGVNLKKQNKTKKNKKTKKQKHARLAYKRKENKAKDKHQRHYSFVHEPRQLDLIGDALRLEPKNS